MQGPSQTCTSAAARPASDAARKQCAKVASNTPCPLGQPNPARPRQPAWAAATQVPFGSVNKTGKQSATMMVQATPEWAVQHASAVSPCGVEASTSRTSLPCTCCMNTGGTPMVCANKLRLAATCALRSPTWSPRLSDCQGACETPPWRVEKNALTCEATGQSGNQP